MPAGWLLPERWQTNAIGLLTAMFLLWVSPLSASLLLLTAGLSYGFLQTRWFRPGVAVLLAIGQAVAVWAVFKSEWPQRAGWWQAGVPFGLSYYAFRQIHYAIERYKRTLPSHTFVDYLRYLFFLPTLLIGPINRFPDFQRDLRRRRWDAGLFSAGLERVLYGYVNIVVLGNALLTDKLGRLIDNLRPDHPALATYLGIWRFALNAYVQFAGFSDVAIGLSLLLGFRIIENFNAPFLATNLSEFWKRYHISLSSWCRDYVFTPLLSLTRRPTVALAASMLVLGGWHEWTSRYLIWGALQGVGILLWTRFDRWTRRHQPVSASLPADVSRAGLGGPVLPGERLNQVLGMALTGHFFSFSCVIVREETWAGVWQTFQTLFTY